MKNKTCGECKHFATCSWVTPDIIADNCEDFEQKFITNGDKIRQMSDEELAEKFVVEYRHGVKDYAYYSTVTCGLYNTKAEAIAATVAKLKEVAKNEQ